MRVLVEEFGELAVGGERGLDGDDVVAGEVGDACDCCLWSARVAHIRLSVPTFWRWWRGKAKGSVPASPEVKMEAMMARCGDNCRYSRSGMRRQRFVTAACFDGRYGEEGVRWMWRQKLSLMCPSMIQSNALQTYIILPSVGKIASLHRSRCVLGL